MTLKIDLEKAYDRLNWKFLELVLSNTGFSDAWINNIMKCVSSATLKLLWDGKKLEGFRPSRGVRQGDAMSPYLFVLCIEQLNNMIVASVNEGLWKAYNYM